MTTAEFPRPRPTSRVLGVGRFAHADSDRASPAVLAGCARPLPGGLVKVLITGLTGFVGPYVAAEVARRDPSAEIFGLVWAPPDAETAGHLPASVQSLEGDVTDVESLRAAMRAAQPDLVFHLAAASSVAASWSMPGEAFEVNAVGTLNLLEAIRDLAPGCDDGHRLIG